MNICGDGTLYIYDKDGIINLNFMMRMFLEHIYSFFVDKVRLAWAAQNVWTVSIKLQIFINKIIFSWILRILSTFKQLTGVGSCPNFQLQHFNILQFCKIIKDIYMYIIYIWHAVDQIRKQESQHEIYLMFNKILVNV